MQEKGRFNVHETKFSLKKKRKKEALTVKW